MLIVLIVTLLGPLLGVVGLLGQSIWLFWAGVAVCLITLFLNMASGTMKAPLLPILAMGAASVFSAHWYVGLGIGLLVWSAIESLGEVVTTLILLIRRMRKNEQIDSSALFETSQKGQDGFFNEKLYVEFKPLFQAAITNQAGTSTDLKDLMRVIIEFVAAEFGDRAIVNMKPYIVRFIADYREGRLDAPTASGNLEQDRA